MPRASAARGAAASGCGRAAGGACGSRAKRISLIAFRVGHRNHGVRWRGGPGTLGPRSAGPARRSCRSWRRWLPEPPLATRATAPRGPQDLRRWGWLQAPTTRACAGHGALHRARARPRRQIRAGRQPRQRPSRESSCADAFALCDALGRPVAGAVGSGEWRAEHLRVLGDSSARCCAGAAARPGWRAFRAARPRGGAPPGAGGLRAADSGRRSGSGAGPRRAGCGWGEPVGGERGSWWGGLGPAGVRFP